MQIDTRKPRSDPDELHPEAQEKWLALKDLLFKSGIPMRLFEAWRHPSRQNYLFSKGRFGPFANKSIITSARAWWSMHQFGGAIDVVLDMVGVNPWSTTGECMDLWKEYHRLGKIVGFVPVIGKRGRRKGRILELPHLQLDMSTKQMREFPLMGNDAYYERLELAKADFPKRAPKIPTPTYAVDRPPLIHYIFADDVVLGNPNV